MPEFPVTLKRRGKQLRIYGPSVAKERYRVVFKAGGKRREKVYPTYELAKREAESLLRQLSIDSEDLPQLSRKETREYLQLKDKAAQRGRSPMEAIHDWYDATEFLSNPADLIKAARVFQGEKAQDTPSVQNAASAYLKAKGPQLAERTKQQVRLTLTRFQESMICQVEDLTRGALKEYIESLRNKRTGKPMGPKARNHHRTYLKGFLKWCAGEMFISDSQWLELSRALENEKAKSLKSIKIHSPEELDKLLQQATGTLRLIIGIAAFAGLRTAELLRLSWNDLKSNYIEVRAENAKTRARRLVPVSSALQVLLNDYPHESGAIWSGSASWFRDSIAKVYQEVGVPKHPNALRHSFISYRLAITGDEKSTALEAGNTPDMIFQHYRELVTKEEAEKWFDVL